MHPIKPCLRARLWKYAAAVLEKLCVITRHHFCMTLGKAEYACYMRADRYKDLLA